jgi:hypothetical protein
MKVPDCFFKKKINGEIVYTWRPEPDQQWIKTPIGATDPVWKQIIREFCVKPFRPALSDMDSKRVLFHVKQIRMMTKDKKELLFSFSVDKIPDSFNLCVFSPIFGATNDIDFETNETGIKVSLPWESGYDFQYNDEKLNYSQKQEMVISQALHYMSTWFGDHVSSDIFLDVVEESNDEEDSDNESNDEKDYTFMDPWIFKLPSNVLVQAQCVKHDQEITFLLSEKQIKKPRKRVRENPIE